MFSSIRKLTLLAVFSLSSAAALSAQNIPRLAPAAGARSVSRARGTALPDSVLVRALAFRSIGPAVMSGRIVDIAVAENPRAVRGGRLGTVIYVAAATGGVWKSTNAGGSWTPVFDSVRVGGVGAVAVAPSNSEVVWVGTGEANNMRSSSWGVGVFKSTDGGRTWSSAMLPKSQHIGRIVIDPRDPNVVYIAATGPLWASGGERGLYKTTDGGRTWTNTKSISPFTGFIDLVMDPSNPDVLYAASFERERREYGFLPAGPESGIYKTVDAGKTWTLLTQGLPSGDIGRIGLSVCRSRPSTVYAIIHARGQAAGVYRSDDAGASWHQVSPGSTTAWYYSQVRCDPSDAEHVVRLNASSQESWDGGKSWTAFAAGNGVHGDHHALWINPEVPEEMILGNDGGLDISRDRGRTWENIESIPVAQFYAISVDDAQPFYNVFGGLQDNQSWGGPSRTRNSFGPTNADWYRMSGGDGFYAVPDAWDNNFVYAESQNGGVGRYDVRTGLTKNIKPVPKPGERHRYNWSAPILSSRHVAKTVYLAANYLFRSPDRGDSWEVISPDLTRNINRDRLPLRGAVPDSTALGRNEGTAEFSNITTIDESPLRPGLLAVGTDDGLIQVTRDGGRSWTKSDRFPTVPETTYVSRVVFSRATEGTIYATFDGHRSNDFRPYVLKSVDYGKTWKAITGDLPDGGSVNVIREHPRQPSLLFVGTEFGVFVTTDGGARWTQLRSGIPGVPVADLQIQARANDLVVGTHGRGAYILDDLTPLEHLARARDAAVAFLFPIQDALLFTPNASRSSGMGSSGFAGQNPPPGPKIAYLLADGAAATRAKLEVVDASGTVVRELPAPRQPGLYRPVWDMRVGAPLTGPVDTLALMGGRGGRGQVGGGRGGDAAGAQGGGGGGAFGGRGGGEVTFPAMPGAYRARLTIPLASGMPTVLEQGFALIKDPMVVLADVDLRQLNGYRLTIARLQRDLRDRQARLDTAQRSLADARRAMGDTSKVPNAVRDELAALDKELADIVARVGSAGGRGGFGGGGGGGAGGRGGRAGGAGPAGGGAGAGGDDDQNAAPAAAPSQTIQARLGTTTELLNVPFGPSADQRKVLTELPGELQKQSDRISKLLNDRIPALMKALKDAGVTTEKR